jgi:L-fuconolactonase
LRPYVEHIIDCFGPERIAWGSDWPVLLLNGSYGRWLEAAMQLIAPLSASAQAGILGRNAVRFYRLDGDPRN